MKKSTILLLFVFLSVIAFNYGCSKKQINWIPPADLSTKQIDRAYLVDLMDQYLTALICHDPAGLQ